MAVDTTHSHQIRLCLISLLLCLLTACSTPVITPAQTVGASPTIYVIKDPTEAPRTPEVTKVTVTISGGFETDPRDHGRPVILIAAALGVPTDVFREAFRHVSPAGPGQEPSEEQAQQNKAALMSVLGPYGVTNDRLDEVSNYYRYSGSAGESWPHTQATAQAIVENGVVTGFVITNPGSGYSSTPTVTVSGAGNVSAVATVSYTTDFATNGAVTAITLSNP